MNPSQFRQDLINGNNVYLRVFSQELNYDTLLALNLKRSYADKLILLNPFK